MATLVPSSKTETARVSRYIQFVFRGNRVRIKLGQVTGRDGDDFRYRLENLLADVNLGKALTTAQCEWVQAINPRIQQRLAEAGVLDKAAHQQAVTLGEFLDSYKAKTSVKGTTVITYGNPIRNLLEYFGRNRPIGSITHADAIEFKEQFLESPLAAYGKRPLAKATVNRRIIMSRQFFRAAKKKGLIAENPFVDIKAGNQRNKKRLVFVQQDWVNRLVEATDDPDWKVLLVLARYGGLRLPSEVVNLRWKHVTFTGKGSILVHSVKTEHHEGKETRFVPLYKEIRAVLLAVQPASVDPEAYVIKNRNYRQPGANLRTQFERIARKAGVKPWSKAFQNMRASRETELIKQDGISIACEIIGNSPNIAFQHYDIVAPTYLQDSVERDEAAKQGVQKGVFRSTAGSGNAGKVAHPGNEAAAVSAANNRTLPLDAVKCLQIQDLGMGDTGLELAKKYLIFGIFRGRGRKTVSFPLRTAQLARL